MMADPTAVAAANRVRTSRAGRSLAGRRFGLPPARGPEAATGDPAACTGPACRSTSSSSSSRTRSCAARSWSSTPRARATSTSTSWRPGRVPDPRPQGADALVQPHRRRPARRDPRAAGRTARQPLHPHRAPGGLLQETLLEPRPRRASAGLRAAAHAARGRLTAVGADEHAGAASRLRERRLPRRAQRRHGVEGRAERAAAAGAGSSAPTPRRRSPACASWPRCSRSPSSWPGCVAAGEASPRLAEVLLALLGTVGGVDRARALLRSIARGSRP